ncbi:exported hypothetical protein [Cupriavidus taiwanensis]|nr:exported hypothetical protein [Cupriavidus taiwanensis]
MRARSVISTGAVPARSRPRSATAAASVAVAVASAAAAGVAAEASAVAAVVVAVVADGVDQGTAICSARNDRAWHGPAARRCSWRECCSPWRRRRLSHRRTSRRPRRQ